jgi:hypothetical protein
LNAREIIGFPEPSAERGFELIAELRRQRQAEIARISGIATARSTVWRRDGRRVSLLRDPRAATPS